MTGWGVAGMRRRLALAACLAALGAAAWGGYVLFRAARAIDRARSDVAAEGNIPFHTARLAAASGPFEPVSAPAVFRDAAAFHGSLWVAGPAGLIEFDSAGSARSRHLAGPEIPAPITAIATGVAPDGAEPELLIATAGEGLLAFNGREFRQVRPDAAPYRDLTAVLPLSTGRILLGTEKKGVLAYDGKRLTVFHPALANLQVSALAGDEGSLWVGTVDAGLLHWHAGEVDRFGEANGLPDAHVLSIAVAGNRAYAGTALGTAEFVAGKFSRVLAEGLFAQCLLARDDALIIGTLEQGITQVPLAPGRARPRRNLGEPLRASIHRLLALDGALYALAEDGLYRIDERRGAWQRVVERSAALLADRNISALEFDSAGRLWVGYFDRGLDILDPGLDRATHVENDRVFCVNRIVHDPARGQTAAATANGLVLFDAAGRQRQVLGRDQGLIANHVTDVVFHPGGMTVATPAGLTFVDASGARSLYAFHGLVNNHVYALSEAHGRLLAGTLGGLSVVEGDTVRASYTTANSGLKHNWITAIVPAGEDWFAGTYGAGVLRFDSAGAWHTFADLDRPFVVNPNAMLATAQAVYAGSLGDGLYVYDRGSGRWRNIRAGLPSQNVTAFAAHGGYIYAGTDNGLVRFPENLR